jgi:hypothetical protein
LVLLGARSLLIGGHLVLLLLVIGLVLGGVDAYVPVGVDQWLVLLLLGALHLLAERLLLGALLDLVDWGLVLAGDGFLALGGLHHVVLLVYGHVECLEG